MQEPEYAPQYSMRERWRYVAIFIAGYTALWAVCEWWAFPQLRMFSQTAHCRTVFGIPGTTVLMYGVFVGLPLLIAISVGAFLIERRRSSENCPANSRQSGEGALINAVQAPRESRIARHA